MIPKLTDWQMPNDGNDDVWVIKQHKQKLETCSHQKI